ncbi:hypothetical protein AMK59_3187, partial [Oryctes borbonicus]
VKFFAKMEKSQYPPPYPQQTYPPPPPPATTVVIGNIPTISGTSAAAVVLGAPQQFGPRSQAATCPHCRSEILTRVEAETTTRTHIMAILLCAFLCLPCMCLPYCMDSCKSKNHYCPNCSAYLGTHVN